jgi:hypothetical protein
MWGGGRGEGEVEMRKKGIVKERTKKKVIFI